MAKLNRKSIDLRINIFHVDNGWVFEVSENMEIIETLVSRSRSELNEIINKLPVNLINRVDSELMEDSS